MGMSQGCQVHISSLPGPHYIESDMIIVTRQCTSYYSWPEDYSRTSDYQGSDGKELKSDGALALLYSD